MTGCRYVMFKNMVSSMQELAAIILPVFRILVRIDCQAWGVLSTK
jgi:hypothetical protein